MSTDDINKKYSIYTVGIGELTVDFVNYGSYIAVNGISAVDYDSRFFLNMYNGVDNIQIEYSVMEYGRQALTELSDTNLKNLIRAMYLNSKVAKRYFGKYAMSDDFQIGTKAIKADCYEFCVMEN